MNRTTQHSKLQKLARRENWTIYLLRGMIAQLNTPILREVLGYHTCNNLQAALFGAIIKVQQQQQRRRK